MDRQLTKTYTTRQERRGLRLADAMILTEDQLVALTRKVRRPAQAAELDRLGITYLRRRDGSLVVSTAHVESLLGVAPGAKVKSSEQPNWAAIAT